MEKLALLGGTPVVQKENKELFAWPIIGEEDEAAALDVIRNNSYSGTDITEKFQDEFAAWQGRKHAIAYCNGTLSLYAAMFAIGLGLRKSEILALQWKDIDTEGKTVSINKARVKNADKEYVLKQTKTFDGVRTLHIPSLIMEELGDSGEPEEFIIQDTPDALDSLYKRLQKKIDFPYNFHSLRHFYASIMLMSGIPNKYAKDRMGHATENMLQRVYQHTFESKQQEYDTVLDKFFTESLALQTE
jgi:integrase